MQSAHSEWKDRASPQKNTNRKRPTARNLSTLPNEHERNTVTTQCGTAQMMTTDCHLHLDEQNMP